MKFKLIVIFAIFTILFGCGTDARPGYFIDMFRDSEDIDRLSECLSEMPVEETDTITVKADKQCLIDLSLRDTSDPNVSPTFTQIIGNPELYMDKLLTFDAVLKKLHGTDRVEVYTNDPDMRFYIGSHGVPLYRLDAEGEEVPLEPNETYQFKCRIYEMKKHADWGAAFGKSTRNLLSPRTKKLSIHRNWWNNVSLIKTRVRDPRRGEVRSSVGIR